MYRLEYHLLQKIYKTLNERPETLHIFGRNRFKETLCYSNWLERTITLESANRLASNFSQVNIIVYVRLCSEMGYINNFKYLYELQSEKLILFIRTVE